MLNLLLGELGRVDDVVAWELADVALGERDTETQTQTQTQKEIGKEDEDGHAASLARGLRPLTSSAHLEDALPDVRGGALRDKDHIAVPKLEPTGLRAGERLDGTAPGDGDLVLLLLQLLLLLLVNKELGWDQADLPLVHTWEGGQGL